MSITLPSDVLDEILNHVEDLPDLLNVALSDRHFSALALHRLQYRDIRTGLHNPGLWAVLSRPDDLRASHVRSLTILIDEIPDRLEVLGYRHTYDLRIRLPAELDPPPPPKFPISTEQEISACRVSELCLVGALRRMTGLQQFRWHRVPRPLLQDDEHNIWSTLQQLATLKKLDIFDGTHQNTEILPPSIITSSTFLEFKGLTELQLFMPYDFLERDVGLNVLSQLKNFLLTNFPQLEVLALELEFGFDNNLGADIDDLLMGASWPHLRVLRMRGLKCGAPQLTHFLIAHPRLEELVLPTMMPGRAWKKLELPSDALPSLHYLNCSTPQAVALLKGAGASTRRLVTLCGVEMKDTVVEWDYFGTDDNVDDNDDEEEFEAQFEEQPSPWKASFLDVLKAQSSLTRIEIISETPEEIEVLSVVAPQLKDIEIQGARRGNGNRHVKTSYSEWFRLFSLFSDIEVVRGFNISWFPGSKPGLNPTLESSRADRTNAWIQTLARSCPKLRVIRQCARIGFKALVIRNEEEDGPSDGVKWVFREWWDVEDTCVKDGEQVYGP